MSDRFFLSISKWLIININNKMMNCDIETQINNSLW
jgi:hypothetical protein